MVTDPILRAGGTSRRIVSGYGLVAVLLLPPDLSASKIRGHLFFRANF